MRIFPFQKYLDELFPKNNITLPCVIVTGSGHSHFIGLQLLIYSINRQYDASIVVFDLGMTKDELNWCKSIKNVELKSYNANLGIDYQEAWFKPFYIRNNQYQKNLWIDADCMVVGDLRQITTSSSLFTTDYTEVGAKLLNKPLLYKQIPNGIEKDEPPYINTGIFVIDKQLDADVLEAWCDCTEKVIQSKELRKAVSCWDQGVCKWALQKVGKIHYICDNIAFNCPATQRKYPYRANTEKCMEFINNLKTDLNKDAVVLHWMGQPKPWTIWTRRISIMPFAASNSPAKAF